MLILIGSSWFELHIDINCIKHPNPAADSWDSEIVNSLNESLDLNIENELISSEECRENKKSVDDCEEKPQLVALDAKPILHINVAAPRQRASIRQKAKTRTTQQKQTNVKREQIEIPDIDDEFEEDEDDGSDYSMEELKFTKTKKKISKMSARKRIRGQRLARTKCQICERLILDYNFEAHLLKMHVPNVIVKDRVSCETCGKSFAT